MLASQVMILEDDSEFRLRAREALAGSHDLVEASTEQEFRAKYRAFQFDLLLLDMRLRRDREGLDVLREVFAQDELQPVIMMSAYGDTESAIEAVGAGAMMFLHKREFTPALLGRMVEAVIEQGRLRRQVRSLRQMAWAGEPDVLLGRSPAIREAAEALCESAANPDITPIITGERGTGATLAARILHRQAGRLDLPFVETDAARLRETQTFFTDRLSPWVQACGGTLAIDGLNRIQPEAGRSLFEHQRSERAPGVVFLQEEASTGRSTGPALSWLREETATARVRLPPLRERREDVPLLAAHFLQAQRAGGHTPARSIGAAALERLEAYGWPGNVRELRNAVEYGSLQAAAVDALEIAPVHLPTGIATGRQKGEEGESWDYRLHLARAELSLADRAVRERGITLKTELVKALGYSDRFTLGRRLAKAVADYPELGREFSSIADLFARGRRK
ncbi:MAG: sigma-54-dependent Fis family transcriptional regulator [Verrucomicrobia bacterium]|nr:sigma-54-dependent Fis family transcriptional regulator [Verrucomicrobiota bacterium]